MDGNREPILPAAPPCILQLRLPFTAGDWQGPPHGVPWPAECLPRRQV